MKRTAEEVANTIDGFVNGTGKQWDRDGFTSIRLDDPELESIRKQIVDLPVQFPPVRRTRGGGLLIRQTSNPPTPKASAWQALTRPP